MFSRSLYRLAPVLEDVVAAFKVLGLNYNPHAVAATRPGVDDVRRQYREMARLHHPDLSSGDDNRMKVINTAYELIQSSGVLQGAYDPVKQRTEPEAGGAAGVQSARFARKAGTRRRRMPDDFANGDDSSWSMKTQLDWQSMMNSTDSVTEEEMKNPANHPFSHSRFFTFEDDLSIYRMIRGGATVRQVARTLGKPATFVERRLQNAQFKLRVQYVLRQETRKGGSATTTATAKKKKKNASAASSSSARGSAAGSATSSSAASSATGHTTSTPITEAATRRVLRRSPYEDTTAGQQPSRMFAANAAPSNVSSSSSAAFGAGPQRKKEWEASYSEWRAPRYRDQMTLEEQGRLDGLLRDAEGSQTRGGSGRGPAVEGQRHASASKLGRSYENYQRLRPQR